jgi:hypothetical protein
MAYAIRRYYCCSVLLLLSILPAARPAAAAIAPDITSLSYIKSALSTPVRLAADSSGSMYVSDPRSGGVVKLASDGSHTATIPAGAGILGVAVALSGELLVSKGSSIAVYSSAGVKLKEFGTFGKANAITITKTGEVFVSDSLNNNVQVFNPDYSPRNLGASNSFGTAGTASGQFRQPTGIAYEKVSDQIAVVDTRNGRIQFFSTSGVYQKSIGSFGAGPLQFTSPQSVSFEYSSDQTTLKRIYVVDAFQSTVQIIDGVTAEFVRYVGGYGITDGKLAAPSDVIFDKYSRLVVANGTGRLSLFGVADPSTGPFLQINAIPQASNLSVLTISGTTTGTSVTINGVPVSVNGTFWSGSVNLVPGVNAFSVVATDANGSTSRTVSITALAPATNPVSLTVSPVASQTSQSSLALSGTVTQGGTVTVNGAPATVNATNWNANITLSAGVNNIRISASKSGMGTSTIDVAVTLDTSTPVIASRLPSLGSVFSTPLQTVSGTVSAAGATTIVVTVNGTAKAVPVSDGVFSIPIILAQGNNSISVVAVNSFGITSQDLTSSVTYDPQAPRVTIASPSAAVSGVPIYRLEGTAPSGSSVTVNGSAVTLNGTGWSTDVQLSSGMNGFEVKASQPSGVSATAMTSVDYSPGSPSLRITSPAKDTPVASSAYTMGGTASPGAVVTARINGVPASVATSTSGVFSLALPTMTTTTGTYTVTVNVTDTSGATSTSTRSIIYDPNPPVINTVSTYPIKMTAPGGVLTAKDKNGPVGNVTVTNGVATLDLTGVTYDPSTLNIQALSPAGLSSRTGSFNGAANPVLADALRALRISAKLEAAPPFGQMLTGDIAPLANYESQPDGKIGLDDVVVILDRVLGIIP